MFLIQKNIIQRKAFAQKILAVNYDENFIVSEFYSQSEIKKLKAELARCGLNIDINTDHYLILKRQNQLTYILKFSMVLFPGVVIL